MNKNNPIFSIIIKALSYFLIVMLITSFFLFMYIGILYNNLAKVPSDTTVQQIETDIDNIENTEISIENKNTFIIVEKNRNYKIYVDTETRNMYISPNTYPVESFTLLYDGDAPKIYKGIINGENYDNFIKNKK